MSKLSLQTNSWFFSIAYNSKSKVETIRGVARWYTGSLGWHGERWDAQSGKWVEHPPLVAAIGISGDSNYVPTTQQKAEAWIKEHQHAQQD